MTISFSGLASGLDTDSWVSSLVSIKQETIKTNENKVSEYQKKIDTIDSLKTSYTTFRSAVEKLTDARMYENNNMFNARSATSSDTSFLTASVSAGAVLQNAKISIKQLATNTSVESTSSAISFLNDNTKISDLKSFGLKEGTVLFSLDNKSLEIEIKKDDTFEDIAQKFKDAASSINKNIDFTINDGILNISSDASLAFTASGTSNFVPSLNLLKSNDNLGYTSTNPIILLDTSKPIISEESGIKGVTKGSFTIGNATFQIDEKTTINSLTNQINQSKDAGVNAAFDQSSGKLKLTATTPGELFINISAPSAEDGGSNFTDLLGLTVDGSFNTRNQTLGQNAIFSVNGVEKTYLSNTIPPSVSGLDGVTLNLNKQTTEDSGEISLSIEKNTTDLIAAIENFVKTYNDAINESYKQTKVTSAEVNGETSYTSSTLSFDSGLNNLIADVRGTVTGMFNKNNDDELFSMLSELGISTAAAGTAVSDKAATLNFDKDKFLEALEKNPEEVQKFLIGDLNTDDKGVMGAIKDKLDEKLDINEGYFALRKNTINAQIDIMNERIQQQYTNLEAYRSRLETQFSNMEMAISQLNQNLTTIQSVLGSST